MEHILAEIFKYLGPRDLSNASKVCKMWNEVIMCRSDLWRKINLTNVRLKDGDLFADVLRRHGSTHLVMDYDAFRSINGSITTKVHIFRRIVRTSTLSTLSLYEFPDIFLEQFHCSSSLRELNLSGFWIVFDCKSLVNLRNLTTLHLRGFFELQSIHLLTTLEKLRHLHLGSVRMTVDQARTISHLDQLQTFGVYLTTLFHNFPQDTLVHLKNLETLSFGGDADPRQTLRVVATMSRLRSLELVDPIVGEQFPKLLEQCQNVTKLKISKHFPTPLETFRIAKGVLRLKNLKHFTWTIGIQCENGATRRFIDLLLTKMERSNVETHIFY